MVKTHYSTEAMHDAFARHVLTKKAHTSGVVLVYEMHEVSTHNNAVTLIFTGNDGTAIMGDGAPCRNGCVSGVKRGLGWFSRSRLDVEVCAAFLETTWQPEKAFAEVGQYICAHRRRRDCSDWQARNAFSLLYCHEQHAFTPDEARSVLSELRDDDEPFVDGEPVDGLGLDYDAQDAARLCAIQNAFAREMFVAFERSIKQPATVREVDIVGAAP